MLNTAAININCLDDTLRNRNLDGDNHIMRNIYIVDHDLHRNDNWSFIIFTVKSALKVVLRVTSINYGVITEMWNIRSSS